MSKFERKFKNGDNVIVKSTGKTGTISGYSDKKYSVLISGRVYKYSTKNLEKTSEKVSEKFQIGDKVKINWTGDKSHGKIGTIVEKRSTDWLVKIPGFKGHDGDIEDGTEDKWYVPEENLTKLPEETVTKFMKIEVKSTPKTSETVSYPCFKKGLDHDSVVLFFNETSGITVEGNVGSFRETRNPKKYGKPLENYSVTFSSIP
jgi:ribosomal protein L21E